MKLMKLREQMQKRELDSLLVTNPYNLRFITGFTGTAGLALITPNDAWFITDFRYTEQAGEQVKEFKVVQAQKGLIDEVARIAKEAAVERLAFEQDYMTFATYSQYQEKLSATLEPVSGLIEKLRMVKSPEELEVLKAAAKIADDAFEVAWSVMMV